MYKEEDKKRSLKVVFHREPLVKVQKISDPASVSCCCHESLKNKKTYPNSVSHRP